MLHVKQRHRSRPFSFAVSIDHRADPTRLPDGLLDIAERFWLKDLTGVNMIFTLRTCVQDKCYMRRLFLQSAELRFSVTKRVDQMKTVPCRSSSVWIYTALLWYAGRLLVRLSSTWSVSIFFPGVRYVS